MSGRGNELRVLLVGHFVLIQVERIHLDGAHGAVVLHHLRIPLEAVVRQGVRAAALEFAAGNEDHPGGGAASPA